MHLSSAANIPTPITGLLSTALALSTGTGGATSLDRRAICPSHTANVSGYPSSETECLNDKQAEFFVAKFKSILTDPNRKAAVATAEALLSDIFLEESDAINILAGYGPIGAPTFTSKSAYIQNSVASAPAIPLMDTLDIFHSGCNGAKVAWRWNAKGIGRAKYPSLKDISTLVVDPCTGRIKATYSEFSSIAWGEDIGWTGTPPLGRRRGEA